MYTGRKIKNVLSKLAANWNNSYWLFAANGTLYLMKKDINNERLMTTSGGYDESAVIQAINIEVDGGDW